ncbi:hypothetical protein ABZW74_21210, partial [Gordonia sp. NPDC003585]
MDRGLPRRGTLGRSLGVAVLGSVGTAAYRSSIESSLPDNLPADAAAAASDSIDGAPTYADELPGALGQQLWRIVSSLVTNHAARQHELVTRRVEVGRVAIRYAEAHRWLPEASLRRGP